MSICIHNDHFDFNFFSLSEYIMWRDSFIYAHFRYMDQPFKTFTQPLRYSSDIVNTLPRTYILTSRSALFTEAAARARERGYRYHELLAAGHDAMVTQPEALARLLLDPLGYADIEPK